MSESPLEKVQGILALQSKMGRPSQTICTAISNLKDLCELNSSGIPSDWRRGGGKGGHSNAPAKPSFRSSHSGGPSLANGSGSSSLHKPSTSTPSISAGAVSRPSFNSMGGSHHVRYQSMFKNSSKPVEDKILNNIILSKLNKFSGSTYNDIRDFLYQILGSGEPDLAEMIREFMMLVFKKAASEEVYCPLYAKLLAEISGRYKVILEEMQKLQSNYIDIFDDVEDPDGGEDYETFLAKNKEKRYRQGYSQFLAELAALEILDLSNLEKTFTKIFELMLKFGKLEHKKALLEEYADCLVRMSKVLKKKMTPFFIEARSTLLRISSGAIEEFLHNKGIYPSLSPKARFILMDVKDNLSGV